MARKNEPEVERLEDGTAAVPVTAENPETAALATDPDVVDAEPVSTKRGVHDSDPIPPEKFAPGDPERPYVEAVTDEHRAFLQKFGRDPGKA